MFVRLLNMERSSTVLPFVIVPCIHLEKAEVTITVTDLGIVPQFWCSCTLQLYISPNIISAVLLSASSAHVFWWITRRT